ncbi:MAG: sigma-70 family RNA polymerase sigma factor [Verrucomicrobia bacterium]|nr:sigma-70 family RNA polymerase sigma factor [Verrucomicrobiota bacterium]
MNDDGSLLRIYAEQRSEAAFGDLVRRYIDLVYSAALRRTGGDPDDAADVVQLVFTSVARQAGRLQHHPALSAWLHAATRNAAIKLAVSERRRRERETEVHRMEMSSPPEPNVEWARLRPILDDVIDRLAESDRTVVILRFFENRPFNEIGAALNTTADAARMRTERALEKLRLALVERGISSTGVAIGALLGNQAVTAAPAGIAATVVGSALGATSPATGILMTKQPMTFAAMAAIAVGTALYQSRNARVAADAAIQVAMGERNRALSLQREAERRAIAAESRADELATSLAEAQAAKPAAPLPTIQSGTSNGGTPSSGFLTLGRGTGTSDPAESRRIIQARNLESADTSYQAYYRKIGFTLAKRAQFKAMLGEYLERRDSANQATLTEAMSRTPRPSRPDIQAMLEEKVRQTHNAFVDSLRGPFGDEAANGFRTFIDTTSMRAITNQLAGRLAQSESPLTNGQTEQLVDLLANNARGPDGKVALAAINVETMLAQAAATLTPAQVEALYSAIVQSQRLYNNTTVPSGQK